MTKRYSTKYGVQQISRLHSQPVPLYNKELITHLIGQCAEVEVVPLDLLVVGSHQEVVALGVHGERADPLCARAELLGQLLLGQVVDADVALRGHEEVRPDRVEEHALHHALGLGEGDLE